MNPVIIIIFVICTIVITWFSWWVSLRQRRYHGIFKYIRHPLYLSLILLGFGILAKNDGTVQWIFALINFVALILTAKVEEKEMILKFGDVYKEYMKKTKMFIPFIF